MDLIKKRNPVVITIDGPAASGKSTIALQLAEKLGFFYFDTGVMYRAVTLAALEEMPDVNDEAAVTALSEKIQIDVQPPSIPDGRTMDVLVDGKDVTWQIRETEIDQNVSRVSAYQGVRISLTEQQRRIGGRGNVVMVGRDIGTVVFPDAEYKFYIDASTEERAMRRCAEIISRGGSASYQETLKSIRRRDQIDSTREFAPLKPAEDAVIINTDGKSVAEVLKEVLSHLSIMPEMLDN